MEVLWLIPLVLIVYVVYSCYLEGENKRKTYFDKLMEDKEFKKKFKEEYKNG